MQRNWDRGDPVSQRMRSFAKEEPCQVSYHERSFQLTSVGTSDWGLSSVSTLPLSMANFLSYIISLAMVTFLRRSSLSWRAKVCRRPMSVAVPSFQISDLEIQHRGQGQKPLSLIVARRTLSSTLARIYESLNTSSLLGIISGISHDARIESSPDTIAALNNNTMLIRPNKLIV